MTRKTAVLAAGLALALASVAYADTPDVRGGHPSRDLRSGFRGGTVSVATCFLDDTPSQYGGACGDYAFEYVSASTEFVFSSDDVDGVGTPGTVWSVQDGTDDVVFAGDVSLTSTGQHFTSILDIDPVTPTFSCEPGSGLLCSADNVVAISTNTLVRWTFDSSSARAVTATGPAMINEASSATNPTVVPDRSEFGSGMGGTNNGVSLITVGTERIGITESAEIAITPATSLILAGLTQNTNGVYHFIETTTPTPIAGYGATYTIGNVYYFQDKDGVEHVIGGATPTFLPYSHTTGPSGVHWMGGYYDAPAADANLTQASTTQTLGTAASGARSAHAFLVAAGGGSTDGSDLIVTVTGTSITDAGVRTTSDSEVVIGAGADEATCQINAFAATTDLYCETVKKWLGQITYTLSSSGGSTFSFDFNYGFAKYDDAGNLPFVTTSMECGWEGGATDTGLDIELLHHKITGWTYSAAAFEPGDGALASCATILSTDCKVINGEKYAFKRTGLGTPIDGAGSEGVLVRLTTGTNNSILTMDCRVGISL